MWSIPWNIELLLTFTRAILLLPSRLKNFTPFSRSSRSEAFCKKGVLKNGAKFTWKHLCQSLFFNKVSGLRSAALLKKRLWFRCFPGKFVKFKKTAFFIEHLRWLLLNQLPNTLHFGVYKRKTSTSNTLAGNYMFNRNNRTRCEICSKLTIKTPEQVTLSR